jgi:DNA helicase-2/ATP-dependent DNA helicase PcrA
MDPPRCGHRRSTAHPGREDCGTLPHGTVLVIGDSINATGRRQMASQTPGATLVEKADLEDLTEFARTFTVDAADAAQRLIVFLADIMTNVGAAELVRRLDSLLRGTARNPPTAAETALLALIRAPGYAAALQAVIAVREQPNVRVYRPEVLNAFINALRMAQQGAQTFYEAALAEREQGRHHGRLVTQRAVGSTLLLKGLEADVGVILYPERMDAKHLYVALTRGARRVVVCSHHPLIGA